MDVPHPEHIAAWLLTIFDRHVGSQLVVQLSARCQLHRFDRIEVAHNFFGPTTGNETVFEAISNLRPRWTESETVMVEKGGKSTWRRGQQIVKLTGREQKVFCVKTCVVKVYSTCGIVGALKAALIDGKCTDGNHS